MDRPALADWLRWERAQWSTIRAQPAVPRCSVADRLHPLAVPLITPSPLHRRRAEPCSCTASRRAVPLDDDHSVDPIRSIRLVATRRRSSPPLSLPLSSLSMRSSRRVMSVALLVCACALAALAHSSVSVSATELLRAVRPSAMRSEFNYQSDLGRIYSEPVRQQTKEQGQGEEEEERKQGRAVDRHSSALQPRFAD